MSRDAETRTMALEVETQQKVSNTLSKIEVALADWEATANKPKDLAKKIEYLKFTNQALSAWEKKSLKGKKDLASVTDRLHSFSEICKKLDAKRPG